MALHTPSSYEWLLEHSPSLLQKFASLFLAAGIGLWGVILLAPSPAPAPAALMTDSPTGQNVDAVIGWFGGGSSRLRITVVGLIASGKHGAALLSINGATPQAYEVGQVLAQGVRLAAIMPQAVSIDQDGISEEITIPMPALPAHGFVPVSPLQKH